MSTVLAQLLLEGMPEPADLRRTEVNGQTVITVGARVITCYDTADLGMRNITVLTLTDTLRFTGVRVGEVMGLTPEYVSMLRGRARRQGSAGLVSVRGRPRKLSEADTGRALAWREEGVSAVQIGARLGVADTTVHRALAGRAAPAAVGEQTAPQLDLDPEPVADPAPVADLVSEIAQRGGPDGEDGIQARPGRASEDASALGVPVPDPVPGAQPASGAARRASRGRPILPARVPPHAPATRPVTQVSWHAPRGAAAGAGPGSRRPDRVPTRGDARACAAGAETCACARPWTWAHAARNVSISVSVVPWPRLTRIAPEARSSGMPMAART